ncbi:MAG: hypothetical protein F6J96_25070 [Symploca sp. SIO1C2]|nr:hypothetical protein [Symploca sp. SIO1C2]
MVKENWELRIGNRELEKFHRESEILNTYNLPPNTCYWQDASSTHLPPNTCYWQDASSTHLPLATGRMPVPPTYHLLLAGCQFHPPTTCYWQDASSTHLTPNF